MIEINPKNFIGMGVLVEIVDMPIGQIKPYKKNPRKNEKAVPEVVKSIKEFGFRQPLVVDSSMVLIVGHTRLLAAKELGLTNVPVHIASTLTPAQVRAYRIADNRSHDKSEWDVTLLNEELGELFEMDEKFDLDFMDFSLDDLEIEKSSSNDDDDESDYTSKIETPIYKITGEKPRISDLVDIKKSSQLLKDIESASLSEEEKQFLRLAAARHSVFNYQRIAEFYAHSSSQVQSLMENSALVIVDFNKAIEDGFVSMSKEIAKSFSESDGDDDE